MSPRVKYWFFLFAIVLITFSVIIASFAGSWHSLATEEQLYLEHLIGKLIPFPIIGAAFLCVIIGGLVSLLFHNYIIPILQMGEEIRLISTANTDYRLKPKGAKELVHLAEIFNESADTFTRMQRDIDIHIAQSKAQLKEERNRLAALMSELPHAVLVCNSDGQILLYNTKAKTLFDKKSAVNTATIQPMGLIGLGRSVFGLLDRDPLAHALEMLNHALARGQSTPISSFMMSYHGGAYLRVNMAPVLVLRDGKEQMSGFVLTLEDMTEQIAADTRRDSLIRSLTDDLQGTLSEIRDSITQILDTPEMKLEQLQKNRKTIDRASQVLEQTIQLARNNYMTHLRAQSKVEDIPGESILEVLAKNITDRLHCQVTFHSETNIWLRLDSYSFVQTLSYLADMLNMHHAIDHLQFKLTTEDDYFSLWIEWYKSIDDSLLNNWRDSPLISNSRGETFSFVDLLEKMSGNMQYLTSDGGKSFLGMKINYAKQDRDLTLSIHTSIEHRPISYEFDLFERRGDDEMAKTPLRKLTFVVFDTETTGLNPSEGDEIIQLGAIRIVNSQILHHETIDQLVDPRRHVPAASVAIHGINPELLIGQPTIDKVLPQFHNFADGAVLVAHNAAFDMRFLQLKEQKSGVQFSNPVLDTLLLSSIIHPNLKGHGLEGIAERLNITIVGRHTALGDSIVTAEVLIKLIPLLEAQGIITLKDALIASEKSAFAKIEY
ncbi:3'-5' exonuclease [Geopsychrobacter electrodiphilus]|uniref:3'-5' exonuclease n=1 Tax=Geopsychrobacter electrodiphilus TaxID=225196 RepID=UPI000369F363|nr:exonuclease domain-containing protein [Geopsychrobacter electrodiphilus]